MSVRPALKRRRFIPALERCEPRETPSGGFRGSPARSNPPPPIIVATTDPPVPLPDLTGTYQGLDGGLYGGGSNVPPKSQADRGDRAAARIRPLDAQGAPSDKGRIGLLAIGQSTTRIIFNSFRNAARSLPNLNPRLSLVNGGQDGVVLQNWAGESSPWRTASSQVRRAGLTNRQVQVVWIEVAEIRAWRYGDLAARLDQTARDIGRVVRRVRTEYPNVALVFLTSRPYGGYAPHGVDPEPYAYESGFGVRLAIRRQIEGDPKLNADPSKGKAVAPTLLWGPYTWANGATPSSTGLSWSPWDFTDGVHPSGNGSAKAARVMVDFFKSDPRARGWFVRS